MYSYILLGIAGILYYLAYKSPKTDLIMYGMSGVFCLLSGGLGFMGYNNIPIGTTLTQVSSSVTQTSIIYSNLWIFNIGLPTIEVLIGLYILYAFAFVSTESEKLEIGKD